MATRICLLAAIATIIVSCGTSKHTGKGAPTLPGMWQETPIVINGDNSDWPAPYPNYDAKGKIAYATSNDADNLYITMETGDQIAQMKILKQGMTVSIDTTGKKEQTLKINFPLANEVDALDQDDVSTSNPDMRLSNRREQKIKRMATDANQMSLEGFSECAGGFTIAQTNPCGIKVTIRMDEYKELVWEAKIPFKAIYNKTVITAADAGKPISVCFAVKGFKSPSNKNNDNNNIGMNSQMSGSGMGGRGGGMGRGSGRGGRAGGADLSREYLYETTKTWKQFGLAWKK